MGAVQMAEHAVENKMGGGGTGGMGGGGMGGGGEAPSRLANYVLQSLVMTEM